MILNNNLYKIERTDTEAMTCRVSLLRDSIIYKAHFPEQPVTPGVCIVQMAGELLGKLLGCGLELAGISNAKFLTVINPDNTPGVTLSFSRINRDDAAGTVAATVAVADDSTVYSKLSLSFRIK